MKFHGFAFAFCLGFAPSIIAQNNRLCILISDVGNGEPLAGATLRVPALRLGGTTDAHGFVAIGQLPDGPVQLEASYVGYAKLETDVMLPMADTLRLPLTPEGEDLEEVIVQSTRTGNHVEDSPIKVEVLGRDDMDEENNLKPNNVASILGDYSGIQIQQTGLSSGNATIRIQGLAGRYTQVLRDGLPLYSGLSGDFGILQIQPLDLQQIELIKGPASTFFGGGAIAGVVNFISKTPGSKPEHAVTLNQTTLGETNATTWHAGRNKRWGYTFFVGATRATAQDVDGDSFTDVARVRTATVHPRLFFYPKSGGQLALGITLTGEKRSGGGLAAVQHQPNSGNIYLEKNNNNRSIADLQYRRATQHGGEWTAKAAFSQFKRQRALPSWTFDGTQQNWFSEIAFRHRENTHFQWVGGVNYSGDAFQKGTTDSLKFGNFQNQTAGIFGQSSFHYGKLDAEAGLRLDWRTTWGAFVLPSVAMLYHLNPNLSLRAGVGMGYITPNLLNSGDADADLRRQLPFPADLTAERSVGGNLEWNYHHLFGDHISLNWNQQFFYTRLGQPVVSISNFSGETSWVNTSSPLTTKGVDHYLRLMFDETELYLGYTYQDARQNWNVSQPHVPLTPKHRAAGVLAIPLGKHFRTGLESAWTGRQTLEDGSKTVSFWFIAGMFGYHIGHFDIVLNGENLLDFRQTRHEQVVLPPYSNPTFKPLWAPVDGRIINLAVAWRG